MFGISKDSCENNLNKFSKSSLTWKKYLEQVSHDIDCEIIAYARESRKIYLGGECVISMEIEEDEFVKTATLKLSAHLYYRDQFKCADKYELKTFNDAVPISVFKYQTDTDTMEILREIKNGSLKISIEKPIIN